MSNGHAEIEMSSQVDLGRITAPPLEAKQRPPLKASAASEISEGARRTQKIIESMDLRRQERARLVAALKSREVEVENEDRASEKRMGNHLAALKEEYERRVEMEMRDCAGSTGARHGDLSARKGQIEKLDASLAQLRKQLDAELGKLDPLHEERKGSA